MRTRDAGRPLSGDGKTTLLLTSYPRREHRPAAFAAAVIASLCLAATDSTKQYGFPYDDDAGQSSDISITNPQYMVVAIGW